MTDDLKWYPMEWVDESCPPHRASASEFLFMEDGAITMGYAPDGPDGCEAELYNKEVQLGELVEFITCEHLPDLEVTFYRDGRHELHGSLPETYNWIRLEGDQDALYDSIEELLAETKAEDNGGLSMRLDPFETADFEAVGEHKPLPDQVRVTLEFAHWSDLLPHRVIVEGGIPKFVAASDIN